VRVTLVVNPSASSVTGRVRALVIDALGVDHDLTVAATTSRGHAIELAARAAATGAEVVVTLGGDGTLNEAANGLSGTSTALAVVPAGSTNVFARTLGFDTHPEKAICQLVAAMAAGSTRRVGLGVANGRHFLFHAGLGFDAEVVERVERYSILKRYVGQLAFLAAAVVTWAAQDDRRACRLTATLGGGEVLRGAAVLCLKTDPYTFLGARPLRVVPGADLDDGLAVLVLPDVRGLTLLASGAAALGADRGLDDLPGVELRTGVQDLVVEGDPSLAYQVDGDYLGRPQRVELHHQAHSLDLVVPRMHP
ncbi:MAG: diacylglycerol/lipid kinase family protein, partial [Acidimicrobiales bacterium]